MKETRANRRRRPRNLLRILAPGLLSLLLPFGSAPGREGPSRPVRVTLDGIDYLIVGDSRERLEPDGIFPLHELFRKERDAIYIRYNIKIPARMRVVLATDAGAFLESTGKDRHTPGIFDPEQGTLYLQNPHALERKGILRRVLSHELCHNMLYSARHERAAPSLLWLEESFCESQSPLTIPGAGILGPLPPTLKEFRQGLTRDLTRSPYRKRSSAYLRAGAWGTFLRRHLGVRVYLELLTQEPESRGNGNTKGKTKEKREPLRNLEPLYREFRNASRK